MLAVWSLIILGFPLLKMLISNDDDDDDYCLMCILRVCCYVNTGVMFNNKLIAVNAQNT